MTRRRLQRALRARRADHRHQQPRPARRLKTDLAVDRAARAARPDGRARDRRIRHRRRADVERLAPKVDAFLVGSSLMARSRIAYARATLVHGRVKFCGLNQRRGRAAAAGSGATHAGFIFAADSPRSGRGNAGRLRPRRRSGAKPVGVFRDAAVRNVADAASDARPRCRPAARRRDASIAELRARFRPSCEIWAACGVGRRAPAERARRRPQLFDTQSTASRRHGPGFRLEPDRRASRLAAAFLAGGIGPANAAGGAAVGRLWDRCRLGSGASRPGTEEIRPDRRPCSTRFARECRKVAACG